jgi:zinc transport system substrate-binding protein
LVSKMAGHAHLRERDMMLKLAVAGILCGLLLAGCVGGGDSDSTPSSTTPPLSVFTSIYPLQYAAERIGGEWVQVTNLVPAGVEAHSFEPSPQALASLHRARLFIYNGAGFEPWVSRVLLTLPASGPLVVNATEDLALRPAQGHDEEDEEDEAEDDHGDLDPHVWLDPSLYARQAELIAAALAQVDPAGAVLYSSNLADFKKEVEQLEREFQEGLKGCARSAFVVSHTSFGYLAAKFALEQVPVAGLSPEAEPSPARLREIITKVNQIGATHIFAEALVSQSVAETIARETGARVLVLNPLEGLTQEQLKSGEDYFTLMRTNLANLREALGCQ